jgi:hypothetical protein
VRDNIFKIKKQEDPEMKIYRTALVILAALAISASLPFASAAAQYGGSQAPATQSTTGTHAVKGSIVSMTPDSVTIRETDGTKITLALDKDTKRTGDLSAGKDVTANYRSEKGKHVASSIKASGMTGKPGTDDTTREKPTPPKY